MNRQTHRVNLKVIKVAVAKHLDHGNKWTWQHTYIQCNSIIVPGHRNREAFHKFDIMTGILKLWGHMTETCLVIDMQYVIA